MLLLTINLYELGQFLRIVLWIFLPMVILSMLITTWLHYRRKEREQSGLLLAIEGFGRLADGEPETNGQAVASPGDSVSASGHDKTSEEDADPTELAAREEWDEGNENIYRGILWMKEKYEQYRDMADKRYEQLREELGRSEQRYQDLMLVLEESKNRALMAVAKPKEAILSPEMSSGEGEILPSAEPSLPADAETGTDRELASKQVIIDDLEVQLRVERLKVEELVIKLQNNSQLLLNIYQELDKSFSGVPVPAVAPVATPIPAATQP
jgi:hypothetical protein